MKCNTGLTLSWRRSRSQLIDLHSISVGWFLYDRELHHERVKVESSSEKIKTLIFKLAGDLAVFTSTKNVTRVTRMAPWNSSFLVLFLPNVNFVVKIHMKLKILEGEILYNVEQRNMNEGTFSWFYRIGDRQIQQRKKGW